MLPRPLPGRRTTSSLSLVVVYALDTDDYRFLESFYPSRRLAEECKNRSIPLRFFFAADAAQLLEDALYPPEIRPRTIVLLRGPLSAALCRNLAEAGYPCFNSPSSRLLTADKLATSAFLEKGRWPAPQTLTAAAWRAGRSLPCTPEQPLVAKPRYGSRGRGVHLVYSAQEIASLAPDFLVQQYIKTSHGRDLRFFFIDGKITAVAERYSRDGSLVSNTAGGGRMRAINGSQEKLRGTWDELVLEIAAAAGLFYGTVDLLYTGERAAEGLTVCEINSSPGFEELEKTTGQNIAGELIDRLSVFAEQLL